jgi:hypothetical protein
VESLLALTVLFSVLLLLGHTLLLGFASVSFGRQRATATQLANQAVEQVRSLPPGEWLMGASDLAGGADPAVTPGCGGAGQYCFRGRHLRSASVTGPAPLVPHLGALPPAGGTVYTRAVYLTDDPSGNPDSGLLTVLVSWNRPGISGVAPAVQVETSLYANASAAAVPGDAWSVSATGKPATVRVTGTIVGTGAVDLRQNLTTVSATASSGLAPTTVVGDAAAPGANLLVGGAPLSSSGGASAQASAPTAADPVDAGLIHNGTPGPVTITGTGGGANVTLAAGLGADSTAGAYAATQANGATPIMGAPAADSDNLEWGRSLASQAGTLTTTLGVTGVSGLSHTPAQLLAVSPATASDDAIVDREATPGQTGSGSVSRGLGTVGLLALPGGFPAPAGWTGSLVNVSGFTATATADAGPGAAPAATTATSTGTVSYWNGAGYTALPLGAVGTTVPVAPVSVSDSPCSVAITGTLTAGGQTTSATPLGAGVTTAAADVSSPLVGSFTFQETCSGTTLADLTIAVDLGDTSAQASYS